MRILVPLHHRVLFLVLIAAGFVAAWPALALAHAYPQTRTPHPHATLAHSPSKAEIYFTEDLEAAFSRMKVTNASGQSEDAGRAHIVNGHPRTLVVPLQHLKPGTYTVHWHVVARDGHTTHGSYTFQVVTAKAT